MQIHQQILPFQVEIEAKFRILRRFTLTFILKPPDQLDGVDSGTSDPAATPDPAVEAPLAEAPPPAAGS